jgi:CRISPR-associated endonuclease/helicase Cas3
MPDATKSALDAEDFAAFYGSVHGVEPFPWQQRLATDVLAGGRWPDLVDVPTGLGKTSVLDVAVFVAAATASVHGAGRLGRRRCFFVVDRRIVVDEAYEHARSMALAIEEAERTQDRGVVGRVAAALRSYAPVAAGELLPVTRMRGGTTWAAAWLDRPDRPGIVLGTVDQVGSRLLFRGYGVSDRRRPIDAALVGTDALVLLDEAHLSTALLTTVSAVQARDRLGVPLPNLHLVQLSATGAPVQRRFALDVAEHRGNRHAWQRLTSGKRLMVEEASSAKDCPKVLVRIVLDRVAALANADGPAPTAAVVCNTVNRAREVHTLLQKALAARGSVVEADFELLVGRSRPLDRPAVQEQILARFGTGRDRSNRIGVLVATQTVEVGVNLDVDVLVTESASWDALVQRLGRLNRLGRFIERFPGRAEAAAVVVHDGQDRGPVYGAARDATWQALRALTSGGDGVDVSPLACRELTATIFAGQEFRCQPGGVPVLLRPTLDAWTHTAPVPLDDPPIEPYLHGFDGGVAAVQVLWRDGLLSDDPLDDPWGDDDAELAAARIDGLLTVCPPRTPEMVEVPFVAVRQWMSGQTPEPVSDLETAPETRSKPRQVREPFRVLAQRSDGTGPHLTDATDSALAWQWIGAEQLRPGDVVVVPSERGGLDGSGWSPADQTQVRDVSEIATFVPARSRRGGMLRLNQELGARLGLGPDASEAVAVLVSDLLPEDEDADSTRDRPAIFGRALFELLPADPDLAGGWTPDAWRALRRWATRGRLRLVEARNPDDGWVADGDTSRPSAWLLTGAVPAEGSEQEISSVIERDDEEVAASSVGPRPVTLAVHLAAVRRRAAEIADALALPSELRAVVADAAQWHDLGKAEERFQVMLHAGDACEAAIAPEPLAKSGMDPSDRLAWRRSCRLSRLPAGARHEAWSAALVEKWLRTTDTAYPGDTDLLLHLVASHHGYARPLARLVIDRQPRPVEAFVAGAAVAVPSDRTVSLEHPARFARLNQRYGRWGLALLEAVVRCADTTVSEEGS